VYGSQNNPLVPRSFRTAANGSNAGTADTVAPPFLIFNDDVRERGQRSFWSAHIAYFRDSLSVIADYNAGYLKYSPTPTAPSPTLPVHGLSLSMGYFLTGEKVERRTILEPKKNFDLRPGKRGWGAFELVGRWTNFDITPEVFDSGLADPSLWSNRAWSSNFGLNWYLNRYVKVYLDWQHSEFGSPVFYAPDRFQITNDLFWLRCQLYF
jgi:phosphate-selective porin OprO/OprP